MATIGQSIVFKGELTGDEDLEVDGRFEGNVDLADHELTIGANGRVTAELTAKSILVIGQVKGNLTATERVEIRATGVVEGDVKTPCLNVQEGAVLKGSIDMTTKSVSEAEAKKPASTTKAPAAGEASSVNPASAPGVQA